MTFHIHEAGHCVDPAYGNPWCNGIAYYRANPFLEDVYGDSTPEWMCDGARRGAEADI